MPIEASNTPVGPLCRQADSQLVMVMTMASHAWFHGWQAKVTSRNRSKESINSKVHVPKDQSSPRPPRCLQCSPFATMDHLYPDVSFSQ
jgi:hypothetical protein